METLRDKMRGVCHDLRMNMLSNVDERDLLGIRSRIAHLPTTEAIVEMPRPTLVSLKNRLDRLMFDIDNSDNSRTKDYAIQHKVERGLPPYRSPILASNWYRQALLKDSGNTSNRNKRRN